MALPGTCAARRWSTQLSVQAPETREDAGVFGFKRRRVCKKTCLEPPYPAAKEYRTALTGSEVPHKAYTTPTRITRDQSPCEVAALEALSARDFSYTAILNALSQTNIPQSSHRKNVIPKGESAVQGMALGLYAYGPKVGFSCSARQAPCLTRLLASFIQHTRPGFPFTSIQVNKNYAARPHVDRNNLGTSLIVGLGEYEGGSLWVHDDTGNVEAVLDEDVFSCHYYKSGNTYRGVELQVWNNIQEFDGNRLHFTRPFNGERFSLVFFTCDRYGDAPDEARIAMSQAGFAFSWEDPKLGMLLQEKLDTKRQAREELIIQRRSNGAGSVKPWADALPGLGIVDGAELVHTGVHLRGETSAWVMPRALGERMDALMVKCPSSSKRKCASGRRSFLQEVSYHPIHFHMEP